MQGRHTVLSETAVWTRVHRIMQRLQDAALALACNARGPNDGSHRAGPGLPKKLKQG